MDQKKVMISSTVLDLPEHRNQVKDACLRLHMFPLIQEQLPASDGGAVAASLKMVDDADVFLGIFGHRYGYVPKKLNPHHISITEMEYKRACERGIPRLIFLMDNKHDIRIADVELGTGAERLVKLKTKLRQKNVVATFEDAMHLRALVVESLIPYRQPEASFFHYIGNIPAAPKRYIAHPYTLLQDRDLVGRKEELKWLCKWARDPQMPPVLTYVGMGGIGKSALTWKWFNDLAPEVMSPLAGRIWWSFYENDARFENLVIRGLAYVSGQSCEAVQQITPSAREEQLLESLHRKPFLLVLDGFERTLRGFAKSKAVGVDSGDDKQPEETRAALKATETYVDEDPTLGPTRSASYRTADPRLGAFLRKLVKVKASKILISSRIPPADLSHGSSGNVMAEALAHVLQPLSDEDALELWRSFHLKVTDKEGLLSIFRQFRNHSLFICSLAGEVRNYRPAPGDFECWRRANPDFRPDKEKSLGKVKEHVMRHALLGLDLKGQQVLLTVAGFRTPATYDALSAILVGTGKLFRSEWDLDGTLTDLEKRGLVGWDRRANRYDLHPTLKAGALSAFDADSLRKVYQSIRDHFENLSTPSESEVRELEDITPAIELYNALIGLGHFDEACDLIRERELDEILHRLSAIPLRVELLELLFPEGTDNPPKLSGVERQILALNDLGRTHISSGHLSLGVSLLQRHVAAADKVCRHGLLRDGYHDLANALRLKGALYESEGAAIEALKISRAENDKFMEGINLHWLAMTLGTRGCLKEAKECLLRTIELLNNAGESLTATLMKVYLAQLALWSQEPTQAMAIATEVHKAARSAHVRRHCIRSSRFMGLAALALKEWKLADEHLHYAVEAARDTHFVEEEVPTLIALAELCLVRRELGRAREFIEDAKSIAVQSPYPLFLVDALNVECRLHRERESELSYEAIRKALEAYKSAWCDGPPFGYHWGLLESQKHLKEFNQGIPALADFESRRLRPLPPWDRVSI